MKYETPETEWDAIDLRILDLLQENCKQSLAAIGQKVGLSAPSVVERIHKLEEAGVICGYAALLDARSLGRDITAFIGVSTHHPRSIDAFAREIASLREVLECHHVTGIHTLMLKVKTKNTESLEDLIGRIRCIDGVGATDTMVVFSTLTESPRIPLPVDADAPKEPGRRARPKKPMRRTHSA